MTGVRPASTPRHQCLLSACAILATLAGCSGTPSSPSNGLSGPFGLVPGSYTLDVYVPRGAAGAHVICVADNGVPDTASIPVVVTAISGGWRVTPVGDANLGLVALLQMFAPTVVAGPVLGQARDPGTGVVVTISPLVDPTNPIQGDAMLQGTLAGRNFAAGGVAGSVQFSIGGAARWCSPNSWILRPRS